MWRNRMAFPFNSLFNCCRIFKNVQHLASLFAFMANLIESYKFDFQQDTE